MLRFEKYMAVGGRKLQLGTPSCPIRLSCMYKAVEFQTAHVMLKVYATSSCCLPALLSVDFLATTVPQVSSLLCY